jgi:hypothetical protein
MVAVYGAAIRLESASALAAAKVCVCMSSISRDICFLSVKIIIKNRNRLIKSAVFLFAAKRFQSGLRNLFSPFLNKMTTASDQHGFRTSVDQGP